MHWWFIFTDVLQIIVDMFLPHLPLSELEEECFSKLLPKVRSLTVHTRLCVFSHMMKDICFYLSVQVVVMFAGLLEEIAKQIGDLSSQNTELHAFLRDILQVLSIAFVREAHNRC